MVGRDTRLNLGKYILTVLICMAVSSCASTKMTGSWADKNHTERLSNVLIIGMSKEMMHRRLFEDTLAEQFQKNGIRAASSAALLAPENKFEREEIKTLIQEHSYDAVIVTRLVGVDKEKVYTPGTRYVLSPGLYRPPHDYYYNFHDYYGTAHPVVYTPGYLDEITIVSLETNIYETAQEHLIWSMSSDSFNPRNVNHIVRDLSKLIVKRLVKDGVI